MRYCKDCDTTKPLSEFHKHGDGYQRYCKPCIKERNRNYYVRNKERIRARRTQGGRTMAYRTDKPTYITVHKRLLAEQGLASNYDCKGAGCEEKAKDWSFTNTCKEPMTSPEQRLYCTHQEHYVPLCRSCHNKMDVGIKRKSITA